MTDEEIRDKIFDIFAKEAKLDRESLTLDAKLEDLDIESLDMVQILFGIDADTYPSDTVEITLEFDGADPVTFSAEVLSLASEMDGMDHENMDMDDEG